MKNLENKGIAHIERAKARRNSVWIQMRRLIMSCLLCINAVFTFSSFHVWYLQSLR